MIHVLGESISAHIMGPGAPKGPHTRALKVTLTLLFALAAVAQDSNIVEPTHDAEYATATSSAIRKG